MLDLSEEFDEENIATCVKYFKRMAPMKLWLEMEIGITGGEEDGVDNSDVKAEKLYTQPEQVWSVHKGQFFSKIKFSLVISTTFEFFRQKVDTKFLENVNFQSIAI